jgi:hypothetical protein
MQDIEPFAFLREECLSRVRRGAAAVGAAHDEQLDAVHADAAPSGEGSMVATNLIVTHREALRQAASAFPGAQVSLAS